MGMIPLVRSPLSMIPLAIFSLTRAPSKTRRKKSVAVRGGGGDQGLGEVRGRGEDLPGHVLLHQPHPLPHGIFGTGASVTVK